MIEIIGYAAGFLTTLSFLPQLLKTLRTRSTKDISLGMFLIFVIGISLWLLYGIMLKETPIIIANSATLILAVPILLMKLKYG